MQQSRAEPLVGASSSSRAAFPAASLPPKFGSEPEADQYAVTLGEAECTIDIPIDGDFGPKVDDPASESATAEVQLGATLHQRYILHRLIGTGGTCRVFLAEDLHRRFSPDAPGELIALKVLRPGRGAHSLRRLRREFLQMQQLTHVSIARVFDLDCDGDVWFMTMELVQASSALTWMSGEYSNAAALRVILACCDAIAHAHRKGIVHGDLKPGNVLVLADGRVKLIDFGSVKGGGESDSQGSSLEATPQYASPAVLAGNMAEAHDDVFSLGCLAYMILARGRHPFDRKPSSEAAAQQLRAPYIPGVPLRLCEVVARALAWDPAQRPASVWELQHALLLADLTRDQEALRPSLEGSTAVMERPSGTGTQPSLPHTDAHGVTAVRPSPRGAVQPQAAANTTQVSSASADHEKSAHTPGDYSCLSQFRGYVARPMLPPQPHHAPIEAALQERGTTLPPEIPVPAVFAPQPVYTPATLEPGAQHAAGVEHHSPRRPARTQRVLVGAIGLTLLVAAGFGAARWSRPTSQQVLAASATLPVSSPTPGPQPVPAQVLHLATPVLEPLSLPRLRAPSVRLAASAPDKPARARPQLAVVAATQPVATARVSFRSQAVEVSPNQMLVAIPVRRSNAARGAARVAWHIEGEPGPQLLDAARAGAQVIQFHDGQVERTLYVPLRKEAGELAADGLRTFRVKLRQVEDGPSPGRVPEVRVTLLD
jgi:serine/threonine protein kinase